MDKILVTGVAGFIGSNLANHLLLNEKNFVYGIDNFSHSTMSNLYPLLKNERFEFIEHDLSSEIPFQVDYVYHFAGNGDLSAYYQDKYTFILNKIEITKNIISYSQKCGAKLIIPSTYQDRQENKKELFLYFDTINLIENLIMELINLNKLNCNIVRLNNVYGENMTKDDKRFIPSIFKNLFSNQDIMLEYDESCYFTYIKDVVINLEKITAEFHNEPIIDIVKNELYLKSDIIKLANTYLKSNSQLHLKNNMRPFPAYTPDCQKSLECKTNVYNGLINTIDNYKLLHLC